ncbi:MAG TPA: phytanoyl-CoA dioxygenase family protein [Burkholderiaceae bacterium]|nr:phytanoyl-CoA dioxygenase family protein [Burkholderiaceae bacterium]
MQSVQSAPSVVPAPSADPRPDRPEDVAAIMRGLYGDGFIGRPGAFPRELVARIAEDVAVLAAEALRTPGGIVPRGPNRFYVEVHPERLRDLPALVGHPWIAAVCDAVLGEDWRVVEIGFDVLGPGAADQPWHRDFAAPPETTRGRRLNSLAFNMPLVDVGDDMGPLEIAPGTQWDDLSDAPKGMFPPESSWPRYQALAQRKTPRMGDVSARSALTVHRGTASRSDRQRPVLVLGIDAPDARNGERHDLQLTREAERRMAPELRRRLRARIVDRLEPIVQAHQIEGLDTGRVDVSRMTPQVPAKA